MWFPYPLRFLLATQPAVVAEILGILYRAISDVIMRCAVFRVGASCPTGAVIGSERFASALNLNIHLHTYFVGGAYTSEDEQPCFHRVRAPTYAELQYRHHAIATHALEKQELLLRDIPTPRLDLESVDELEHFLTAAVHYRIATSPSPVRKAPALRTVGFNSLIHTPFIAQLGGFSLPARARCQIHQRDSLKLPRRYIARPELSYEHLSINDRGQVVYRLGHLLRDGTTLLVLDPIESMRHLRVPHTAVAAPGCANRQSCRFSITRLAARVPRPRVHFSRYHGAFAPKLQDPPPHSCQPYSSSRSGTP